MDGAAGLLRRVEDAVRLARQLMLAKRFADVVGLPTNYVIDKSGVLRYAKAGAFDLDDLNALLVPLMNEPAPTQ